MRKLIINIDWLPENYAAAHTDIPVVATGSTVEEVKTEFKEALEFHIEGIIEDGEELPEELKGTYELFFNLSTRARLKFIETIINRKALARATGINVKQLGHYATGYKIPRDETRKKITRGIKKLRDEFDTVI